MEKYQDLIKATQVYVAHWELVLGKLKLLIDDKNSKTLFLILFYEDQFN